jgi:hypothetical protein
MTKIFSIKKIISAILLGILILPNIAMAENETYKSFLKSNNCVASYSGDPLCKGSHNTSGSTLDTLYKAIFSQGAVITLLDEPLSDDNIITVLKMCSYKETGTGTEIVINNCSEYYTESCPNEDITGIKHISNNLVTTKPSNKKVKDIAYFTCTTKQVIIAASGTGLIQKYLRMIYNLGTAVAGIFAILIIMFNGIKISVSGSDESAVDEAKKQITNSLLALTVLFLSGFILYIINPNFFTSL